MITQEEVDFYILAEKISATEPSSLSAKDIVRQSFHKILYLHDRKKYVKCSDLLMSSFDWASNLSVDWISEYNSLITHQPMSRVAQAQIFHWISLL